MVNAFDSLEIDANLETPADYVDFLDKMGLMNREVATATTLVARNDVSQQAI